MEHAKESRDPVAPRESKGNEILGVILVGLAALFAVTIYFRINSAFGDVVHGFVFGVGGVLGYLVPILFGIAGVLVIAAKGKCVRHAKLLLVILAVLLIFSMVHLGVAQTISVPGGTYGRFLVDSYEVGARDEAGGGVLGALITYWTYTYMGLAGSWIVLVVGMAVCVLALTNLSIRKLSADIGSAVRTGYDELRTHVEEWGGMHRDTYADGARRKQAFAASGGSDNPFNLQIQQMDSRRKAGGRKKAGKSRQTTLEYFDISSPQGSGRHDRANVIDLSERRETKKKEPRYASDPYRQVFADTDIRFDDEPVLQTRGRRKLDANIIESAQATAQPARQSTPRRITPQLTPKGEQEETVPRSFEKNGLLGQWTLEKDALPTAGPEDLAVPTVVDDMPLFEPDEMGDEAFELLDYSDLEAEPQVLVLDKEDQREAHSTPPQDAGTRKAGAAQATPAAMPAPKGGYHVTTEQNRPGTAATLSADMGSADHDTDKLHPLPPMDLLELPPRKVSTPMEELQATAAILERTLGDFKIEAHVVDILEGPVVTRFELQVAPGIRVSRIVGLADNLALEMSAPTIRIEAPVPGKPVIGIEVPNKRRQMVGLRELLEDGRAKEVKSDIAFALGKDITGTPVFADIAKMPHLLIAGQTGAGKSVCLNSLIVSILLRATPDDVKLIMVDPKHVELNGYNGIPHLISPVISDPKTAALALNWACSEQHRRYELLQEKNVRNIEGYNKWAAANGEERMPFLVLIVDEFAELLMGGEKDIEASIQSIAQLGRAGGVHLVLATQRPTTDVITGRIKANVPGRIAFSVKSQIDSRTILDCVGAEKLLGKGDMLFYMTGLAAPERIQGCNVTDPEIERVVEFWRAYGGASQEFVDFSAGIEDSDGGVQTSSDTERDPYFVEAARIAVEDDKISTSLLQRRLQIGYGRAARLVDQLQEEGIVSGSKGSKARDVLISAQELEERFGA